MRVKKSNEDNIDYMDGIIGHDIIKNIMRQMILKKYVHNMIFCGKTGTGKSLIINTILRSMYKDKYNDMVLYISVNNERGINSIREKVKLFSNTKVPKNNNYPIFKVIVFDQADSVTIDAQNALRRIIELSSSNTRFIFMCYNLCNIIEPIQSRCITFIINEVSKDDRVEYYRSRYKFTDLVIDNIIDSSNNDLRKEKMIINLLNKKINKRLIFDNMIQKIDSIYYDKIKTLKTMSDISSFVIDILSSSIDIRYFINNVYEYMVNDRDISFESKKRMIDMSFYELRYITKGCDMYLSLLNYISNLRGIFICTHRI